jgi:RHS repeat-associated protein
VSNFWGQCNYHFLNIRVSFTREGAQAAIVEKNDYYAFGLKYGNPADTSGVNYNYEYNGKEFQEEIGMYDYGTRFYLPDIGRLGVVDNLVKVITLYPI